MNKHACRPARLLKAASIATAIAFAALSVSAEAALTKLSDLPLNAVVKAPPNVVFTVDDSSSMLSDFLPDLIVIGAGSTYCRGPAGIMNAACGSVGASKQPAYIYSGNNIPWGVTANVSYASGNPPNAFNYTASSVPATYQFWPAPVHSGDFNLQYYNPRFTYQPPVNGDAARTPFGTWNSAAGTTNNWRAVLTDPWWSQEGLVKTTVNMQTTVSVGMWCNNDWPVQDPAWVLANGNAVTGAGDVNSSGADCRINGTVYDASLRTGASKANGDYQYPFGSVVGKDNFFRSGVRNLYCDKTLGKMPMSWPQSCAGNNTWACTLGGTVIWPATQPQSCVFTSYKLGACVNTYTPVGCNTDPTYDLGGCTGSECKVCTNNGCTQPKTGQNGACHLTSTGLGGSGAASCNCAGVGGACTLACTTGAPNCVPASQTCADFQPPPTGCTVGVLTQNQTCSQTGGACNAVLWDTAANVPTGTLPSVIPATTMYQDSLANGVVCRHNNKAYPTAPGTTSAINNFPTGVFNQTINSSNAACGGVVPTTVAIPRHYWKTSVEWCTAKVVTTPDKWQGFGSPGTCQDAHDVTHIYPRFYKFGVDKADPAYADNYAYAYPAFERVTFDFTKIGNPALWITHQWKENGNTLSAPRTFDQEMENYSNWFVYYRTRILALKSSASLAFQSGNLDNLFRVSLQTLSNGLPQSQFVNIGLFDTTTGAQRQSFYDTLFKINIRMGVDTPNLDAIVRVGDWFVNGTSAKLPGSTDPLDDVTLTCQKNFHMLFTDGITNQATAPTTIGDFDSLVGLPAPYSLPLALSVAPAIVQGNAWPAFYEEGVAQSDTAADYALKYWITKLRPLPVWKDNVPANLSGVPGSDPASWQHVNFAALALGTEGTLPVGSQTTTESKLAAGTLQWPKVVGPPACVGVACVANTKQPNPTGVDDLWHAAVNGRGRFVNAENAQELRNGFEAILADIQQAGGARTGAANPNPNLTSTNKFIYRVKFESGWVGSVQKIEVDPATAIALPSPPNPIWEAATQLSTSMAAVGTPWYTARNIVTMDDSAAPVAFRAPVTPPPPNTHITTAQYNTLGGDDPTRTAVLEYIRGNTSNEGIGINSFRARPAPLGDIVNSQASVVGPPMAPYLDIWDPSYTAFAAGTAATRSTRIYVGANDGMMHAFKDTTGDEAWAYIPWEFTQRGPIVTDGLKGLSVQPLFNHHMYVDGPTKAGDVHFGLLAAPNTVASWHTLLVGGLGKGGKSYYALDITDPDAVVDEDSARKAVLWEFRDDSAGANKHDIGYTYGKPVFGKLRAYGWVVIVSGGYNNASGKGKLYILDPSNGNLLETLTTGSGTAASPSGLVHFNGFTLDLRNQIIEQLYAGDLNGDVWRWDVSSPVASTWNGTPATKIAHLADSLGVAQPVTTPPQIEIDISNGVDRYVFIGTGQLLDDTDLPTTQVQSMYAIRDGTNLMPAVFGAPITRAGLSQVVATSINGLPTQPGAGWYQDLTDDVGSRIVVPPEADIGLVAFVATIPSNDKCIITSPARIFVRQFTNGASRLEDPATPGTFLPSLKIDEGGAGIFFGALAKAGAIPGTYIPDLRLIVTTAEQGLVFTYTVKPPNLVAAHRMSWRQLGQ